MAIFTYTVKYRYICENCAQTTDWMEYTIIQDAGSLKSLKEELLIDLEKSGLNANKWIKNLSTDNSSEVSADVFLGDNRHIKNVHDKFHTAMETEDFSILKGGEKCPHCGARQSWCPRE